MPSSRLPTAALIALATCAGACSTHPVPRVPPFPQAWIDATRAEEPQTQVQRIDADTYVIRQSIRTNFEGPFLYLLFGHERALLLDSGAGGLAIRPAIQSVIDGWLVEHHRRSIELIVAHSHSHHDHVAGDAEFAGLSSVTVVGLAPAQVAAFFAIRHWPDEVATYDLGGRPLAVIPTPGHEPAAIMVYDPRTELMFSGDALYPGRLYFPRADFVTYREGIDRVVAYTAQHPVRYLLGAHIEMTRSAGADYAMRAPEHPDEHVLELPYARLLELQAALHAMGETPQRAVHDDFIVYPRP